MSARRTFRLPGRTSLAVAGVAMVLAALVASLPSSARPFPTPERATAIVDPALAEVKGRTVDVIVQGEDIAATELAVSRAGGTVTRFLPVIDGLAATLPADAVTGLSGSEGVRVVSLDREVQVQGGGSSTAADSKYRRAVRAEETARAGKTGAGVTVALIDTGIADVGDLQGRVRTITDDITGATSRCVNLSGDDGCGDSYGHGTFIAGIIAGTGAASDGEHAGVAPGADLVSIKIAGADGSSDVSNVIAGIQWAVSFKDRYGIKVLNLSLGTDGTQTYRTDPLNYAVEKAWSSGMVVVVAASNRGPAPRTISKPGDDPWVITVGAVDDHGTPGLGDDTLPNFSSHGPTAADGLAKPDLVAPGAHIVSLRAPGSSIDRQFPNYVGTAYRRGSGTSMATGVVSGSVALMLEANPGMTPDRVKYALTSTARRVASDDRMAVGAGMLDTYAAGFAAPPGVANQGLARSNGLGSLDASRGTTRVKIDRGLLGTILYGSLTAQALLWNPILFTTTSWTGSSWYGSSWYGSSWYGSSWYGSSWYGSSWYGSSWYGQPEGSSWYGSSWYGSSWYGGWE
jgi:serine protease AprX